jgi:hypothetical protein
MDQPSDYDDGLQESLPPERPSSAPKTIGILNIIFASLLLLCGICSAIQSVGQAALEPMMKQQQEQAQQQIQQNLEAQRQSELKALEDQEKRATTAQEKAAIQAERKALQAQPLPKAPDMSKLMEGVIKDPTLMAYSITDVSTSIILNLLMLIAGIGLVGYKEWARVTALWVAGLKIIRLLALYGAFIALVAPVMTKKFVSFFEEFAQSVPQRGGGPNMQQMPQQVGMVYGVMFTIIGIAMIVLGSIYPLITLWVLTRRGAKAACANPPVVTE